MASNSPKSQSCKYSHFFPHILYSNKSSLTTDLNFSLFILKDISKDEGWVKGLNVHTAASSGDMDALIAIAGKNIALLKKKDNNGWNSLHEAGKSAFVLFYHMNSCFQYEVSMIATNFICFYLIALQTT